MIRAILERLGRVDGNPYAIRAIKTQVRGVLQKEFWSTYAEDALIHLVLYLRAPNTEAQSAHHADFEANFGVCAPELKAAVLTTIKRLGYSEDMLTRKPADSPTPSPDLRSTDPVSYTPE